MPSQTAVPGPDGVRRNESISEARGLLTKALEIVDALSLAPEVGAKIEEAVAALDETGPTV